MYSSCWNSEGSHEVKPQSIFHHIGRLGSKVVKPISRKRNRMLMQRKLHDSLTKFSEVSVTSVTLHESESSISFLDFDQVVDDTSHGDYHTLEDSENGCSFLSDMFEDDEEDGALFETLDQNELLSECFLNNQQSDVLFLVHFFNQETSISDAVEDTLSKSVLETSSKCECRRINSKSAPLFTSKLQIDPEQPTVVAIKNGKVLCKVSDISSSECTEVDQWLTETRILQTNAPIDTFSGVSTT